MSALSVVRFVLESDPSVVAKVSGRLFFIQAPQSPTLPAIVLHSDSQEDETYLGGSVQYPVFRFIVDCLGSGGNPAEADSLGNAVVSALRDYRGIVPGFEISYIFCDDMDFFDRGEQGRIWRRRLAFRMRYRVVASEDSPPSPIIQ